MNNSVSLQNLHDPKLVKKIQEIFLGDKDLEITTRMAEVLIETVIDHFPQKPGDPDKSYLQFNNVKAYLKGYMRAGIGQVVNMHEEDMKCLEQQRIAIDKW